jgi:hypothetical protein
LGSVGYATPRSLSAKPSEALGAISASARTSAASHGGVGTAPEPPTDLLHSVTNYEPRDRAQDRANASDKPQNWYLFNDEELSLGRTGGGPLAEGVLRDAPFTVSLHELMGIQPAGPDCSGNPPKMGRDALRAPPDLAVAVGPADAVVPASRPPSQPPRDSFPGWGSSSTVSAPAPSPPEIPADAGGEGSTASTSGTATMGRGRAATAESPPSSDDETTTSSDSEEGGRRSRRKTARSRASHPGLSTRGRGADRTTIAAEPESLVPSRTLEKTTRGDKRDRCGRSRSRSPRRRRAAETPRSGRSSAGVTSSWGSRHAVSEWGDRNIAPPGGRAQRLSGTRGESPGQSRWRCASTPPPAPPSTEPRPRSPKDEGRAGRVGQETGGGGGAPAPRRVHPLNAVSGVRSKRVTATASRANASPPARQTPSLPAERIAAAAVRLRQRSVSLRRGRARRVGVTVHRPAGVTMPGYLPIVTSEGQRRRREHTSALHLPPVPHTRVADHKSGQPPSSLQGTVSPPRAPKECRPYLR